MVWPVKRQVRSTYLRIRIVSRLIKGHAYGEHLSPRFQEHILLKASVIKAPVINALVLIAPEINSH